MDEILSHLHFRLEHQTTQINGTIVPKQYDKYKNRLPQGEFLVALSGLIMEVENEIDPNKSFQDKSIWRWREEYTLSSWNQQLKFLDKHHPKKTPSSKPKLSSGSSPLPLLYFTDEWVLIKIGGVFSTHSHQEKHTFGEKFKSVGLSWPTGSTTPPLLRPLDPISLAAPGAIWYPCLIPPTEHTEGSSFLPILTTTKWLVTASWCFYEFPQLQFSSDFAESVCD